jgi:hypothetical protein
MDEQAATPEVRLLAMRDAIALITAMRADIGEPMEFESTPRMFAYAMTAIALNSLKALSDLGGDADQFVRDMAAAIADEGE